MANLNMQSSDGKVLINVSAGLGGFHSATIQCGPMKLVMTAQQLVDYLAPFIAEQAEKYVPPAAADSTA